MSTNEFIAFQTTRFGEISVEHTKTIEVQGGLLGFPQSTRYVILDHEEDSPFKWLQSCDEGHLAFVITDPMIFFPDYKVQFRREEIATLKIDEEEDLAVFVLLSLHTSDIHEMTANLQGPIVVNAKTRVGRQVVLKDTLFRTKHKIFPEIA
jgi:flagellar assembly factor FliW